MVRPPPAPSQSANQLRLESITHLNLCRKSSSFTSVYAECDYYTMVYTYLWPGLYYVAGAVECQHTSQVEASLHFCIFSTICPQGTTCSSHTGKLVIFLTFVYFSLVQQWQSNFYYYLKKMPKKCTKSTSVAHILFATYQHWRKWEVSQWSVVRTWTPNVTVGLCWVSGDTVPLVGIERWGRRIKSYGWYHPPSKFMESYLGLFLSWLVGLVTSGDSWCWQFGGGGICGRISATLIHRPCHQDVDQPLTNSAVHWVKCCLIALQAIARVMVGQKSVITKERLIGQRFNWWTTRTSLKSVPYQHFRILHFVCFHWVWKRHKNSIGFEKAQKFQWVWKKTQQDHN